MGSKIVRKLQLTLALMKPDVIANPLIMEVVSQSYNVYLDLNIEVLDLRSDTNITRG